jgi:hypothetical protein
MQTQAEHFPTSDSQKNALEKAIADYHEVWPGERKIE